MVVMITIMVMTVIIALTIIMATITMDFRAAMTAIAVATTDRIPVTHPIADNSETGGTLAREA